MINKIISVVLMLIVEAAALFGIGLLGSVVLNHLLGCNIGIICAALSITGFALIVLANIEVIKRFIRNRT